MGTARRPFTKHERDERRVVDAALEALDSGAARVAEQGPGGWRVNQWLKKAVLLSFRLTDSVPCRGRVVLRCGGQGADEVAGLGREPVPRSGIPRGAWRGGDGGRPMSRRASC